MKHRYSGAARYRRADAVSDTDEDPIIYVCKGPPVCTKEFADDEDPAPYTSQCPWCQRIIVHPDGTETIINVSRA
jgi:hypothetical protein